VPYIKQPDRYELDHGRPPRSPGELNYRITALIREYVEFWGLGYPAINDVLGALDGAKSEFYRRVAAPYEDGKIVENGDVYDE
jgi:hypothetical protein